MSDRETLKAMIETAKRSMNMLDLQLHQLSVLSGNEAERVAFDDAEDQPFFYGLLGPDGEPGLSMGQTAAGVPTASSTEWKSALEDPFIFTGYVRLQSDAPFIWTHVLVCQAFPELDIGTEYLKTDPPTQPFSGIQRAGTPGNQVGVWVPPPDSPVPGKVTTPPIVELGFVDDASGRILFQANRQLEQGHLMPGEMFDTVSLFPDFPDDDFDKAGSNSPGHGPRMTARLPCEVTLPANGVLRVMAKPSFYDFIQDDNDYLRASRLYVTLVGRKVYGD